MARDRLVPLVIRLVEDGQPRRVQVGQAFVTDDEVVLSLEPLSFALEAGATTERPQGEVAPLPASPRPGGRLGDLEWLAQRSRRVLADPRKRRWHGDVRAQLAEIEAELVRLKERSPG